MLVASAKSACPVMLILWMCWYPESNNYDLLDFLLIQQFKAFTEINFSSIFYSTKRKIIFLVLIFINKNCFEALVFNILILKRNLILGNIHGHACSLEFSVIAFTGWLFLWEFLHRAACCQMLKICHCVLDSAV